MSGKTLVLLTASGELGFASGGIREGWNHLDPHIRTLAHYLGVGETHHVAIEYQEFRDTRHDASVEAAHAAVPGLVERLTGALSVAA